MYYATTSDPWNAALKNERTRINKVWTKAIIEEVPLLVAFSDIEPHMKPEIIFTGFQKSDGGFVSAVFNITMRRPHWDNPQRFSDALTATCDKYEVLNETEGVFGVLYDGWVKHRFLTHRLVHVDDVREDTEDEEEDPSAAAAEAYFYEEEKELTANEILKLAREEDTVLR